MILDCCFSAKAFARDHVGKRKFELMTSAAHNLISPAPHLPHSFTKTLYDCLKRLIEENPKGFHTSHLYREIYHALPITEQNPKPLLFDQARHSYGKIWLRPQVVTDKPPKAKEEGRYLKLTFRLNANPDLAVMNELALHLQFLPHVDQIRFEDLSAPREQITNLIKWIVQAGKLRPLLRKIHARRQMRKIGEMTMGESGVSVPSSLRKLILDQKPHAAYDWSSASEVNDHNSKHSEHSRDQTKSSGTLSPAQATISPDASLKNDQLSTENKLDNPGAGTWVSTFIAQPLNMAHGTSLEQADGTLRPSVRSPGEIGEDSAGGVTRTLPHADKKCFSSFEYSTCALLLPVILIAIYNFC